MARNRVHSMVKESIASIAGAGLGDVTLDSAVTGYLTHTSRLSDGEECYVLFSLEDGNFNGDANDWEISRCTFTTTGTLLARDVVLESSNSDAAITITTSHIAAIINPAEVLERIGFWDQNSSLAFQTFLGVQAGNPTANGFDNTCVGGRAGNDLTTGQENVFIGSYAGDECTAGSTNTYVGKDAGKGATGSSNVAIGKDAMGGASNSTGSDNVVIGEFAGDAFTTTYGNTLVGALAGTGLTSGFRNTLIGSQAGDTLGTGDSNIGIGHRVGFANADYQLAIGYRAVCTGTRQVVIGSGTTGNAHYTDVYFNGVVSTTPDDIRIQAAGGSGTNVVGADMNLAPGKSTGNAVAGNLNFQTSDAGGSGTTLQSLSTKGYIDGADGGLVWGSPTGGSQGAGTINAVGVYDDSALLTDYIFEIHYDGKAIDPQWSDYKIKSLDEEIEFVKENKHLSTIIGREEWGAEGKKSTGELISQLWATVETQHLYIAEMNERLKKLEGK